MLSCFPIKVYKGSKLKLYVLVYYSEYLINIVKIACFFNILKIKINHLTKTCQNSQNWKPKNSLPVSIVISTKTYKHITEKNETIQLFCIVFIYKNMRYFICLLFITFLCETSNAAVETVCRGWRRSHARKARNKHVNTRTKHLMHL